MTRSADELVTEFCKRWASPDADELAAYFTEDAVLHAAPCDVLAIRAYHRANGQSGRDVCLIPASAHGTNAASAVMAGMRVVVVASRPDGTVDLDDLEAKVREHSGIEP